MTYKLLVTPKQGMNNTFDRLNYVDSKDGRFIFVFQTYHDLQSFYEQYEFYIASRLISVGDNVRNIGKVYDNE